MLELELLRRVRKKMMRTKTKKMSMKVMMTTFKSVPMKDLMSSNSTLMRTVVTNPHP